MKEIKFRAWDKIGKHIYYSFPIVSHGEANIFLLSDLIERWKSGNYILMQYTGLKDKNGKEIYEGDVLQLGEDKRVYWIVGWDKRDDLPRGFTMEATYPQYMHPHIKETHIIGNIYENPELLK